MRWLRTPLLHFVLIGGLLWAGRGRLDGRVGPRAEPVTAAPIVVTERAVERLRSDFATRTGAEPTPAEAEALVAAAIDEELLLREALRLGLDRNDRSIRHYLADKARFLADEPAADDELLARRAIAWGLDRNDLVVRRMLVDKMRLLATRAAGDGEPGDAELEAFLERHADRYRKPARASLTHVFFGGADGGERARAARRRLASAPYRAAEGAMLGDSFPLGARFRDKTERDLAKLFGAGFAARVMRLEAGLWSDAIASPYGTHLVRVDAKRPAELPPLAEVRSRVALAYAVERRGARLRAILDRLRSQTPVRIARANDAVSDGTHVAREGAEYAPESAAR